MNGNPWIDGSGAGHATFRPAAFELLAMVDSSAEILARNPNDILDFSRSKPAAWELDPIPFLLRECGG